MKRVKLTLVCLIAVFSFGAVGVATSATTGVNEGNTIKEPLIQNQDDDDDKPSIQTNNFARKGIGFESVVQKVDPENTIGEKGVLSQDWSERKGKIGYDANIDPDEEISPEREPSDLRTLEDDWSERKGKIGYDAIIDKND